MVCVPTGYQCIIEFLLLAYRIFGTFFRKSLPVLPQILSFCHIYQLTHETWNKYPIAEIYVKLQTETARYAPACINNFLCYFFADCLQSFTDTEELADTERYTCGNCQKRQRSTKKFWIRRLPNVRVIWVSGFQLKIWFKQLILL